MFIKQQLAPDAFSFRTQVKVVDYRTCDICSFRLVRVEPCRDRNDPKTVESCPICGMFSDEKGSQSGRNLSSEERQSAFDAWLAVLGLSRKILQDRYRLRPEHFFEN